MNPSSLTVKIMGWNILVTARMRLKGILQGFFDLISIQPSKAIFTYALFVRFLHTRRLTHFPAVRTEQARTQFIQNSHIRAVVEIQ